MKPAPPVTKTELDSDRGTDHPFDEDSKNDEQMTRRASGTLDLHALTGTRTYTPIAS